MATATLPLIATAVLLAYWVYSNVAGLRKNLAAAKKTGLPYVVSPINLYNPFWLTTHELLIPLIKKLPNSWWEEWLDYMDPNWTWRLLHDGFKKKGDVFIFVSPGVLHIYLANAEAIRQVTSRREAFPKPLEPYQILNAFGRNLLSTEGAEWKAHRKVSSPSFTEKNNALVFEEAARQAQGMMSKWMNAESPTINEAPTDTMRLTLHTISRVGFGVSLLWPGQEPRGKQSMRDAVLSSNVPAEGHTMSFENSLVTLLDYLLLVLLLPKWLLRILPFKAPRSAYESYINWKHYMDEMFAQKIEEAREGKNTEGMDIMGSLVRSSYGKEVSNKESPSKTGKSVGSKPSLSDSDILGNAFVILLAGHETTANSIHFSLIELAINPVSQRAMHTEVHNIFGDTPPEKWDYESNINTLLGGMVGAVLNEQLRLMPPVIAIPKSVSKTSDQTISLDGKKVTLPAGAQIALATPGVQRNPRYWPTRPSQITGAVHDLDDFKPERWLTKSIDRAASANGSNSGSGSEIDTDEEFGGFTGQNTPAQFFRPVRGSYLPFSDGPRSCLGRRLAQVKVMAVLAVIFQTYSIELAVDEWASDEEVARMTQAEKRVVYGKAQDAAKKMLKTATHVITLKLHPGFIPIRVVRKGEERFVDFIE